MSKSFFYILIIFGIAFLIYWFFLRKFKAPILSSFTGFSGGLKTGKSTTSVAFSLSDIKRRRRKVKILNFIIRFFRLKKPLYELPLYYSNVPIDTGFGYVPVTRELLMRETRFVYGSVIYLQEVSLIADSMDWGCEDLDSVLKNFCKLIGHETKGGALYWDTQSISDMHFSFKKCTSQYIYILKLHKYFILPFIRVDYRQLYYSYDGSEININDNSINDEYKSTLIWKSVWKKFDCCCYSILTDNLPVENKVSQAKVLKADKILSVKDFVKEEKEKQKFSKAVEQEIFKKKVKAEAQKEVLL